MRPARPVIEVAVLHGPDAEQAEAGGADRLLVTAVRDGEFFSPEPATVGAIRRVTDVPLWATLKLTPGDTTTGGELTRLVGLAGEYLSVGARGVVLGFLTADLEVDSQVIEVILSDVPELPWMLDRCFDRALDSRHALRQVVTLPGLAAVQTAGAAIGMSAGFDDLVTTATADAVFARLVTACGADPEHVPWLLRSGVRQFQLGANARASGSWTKSFVEAGRVRSWRTLVDDLDARVG